MRGRERALEREQSKKQIGKGLKKKTKKGYEEKHKERHTAHSKKWGGLLGRGASCSYSNRWHTGPITTPMPGC